MKPDIDSERRLEEIARQLGAETAGKFDADATTEKVMARLRTEGQQKKPFRNVTRILMRVAAVAVIAIGLGVMTQGGGPLVESLAAPVELADLSDDELTEVIDSLLLDEPVYELAASDLYDLDETELAELLELMEG